jgi:nucleotide-binding universal stress UspA family protein
MTVQESGGADRFKKILVAVDYSPATPEIFNRALELAQTYGSRLLVFHCLQRQFSSIPDAMAYAGIGGYSGVYSQEIIELEEQLIAEATEELLAWLSSFLRQAKNKGVGAETDYAVGDSGRKICETAENWGADLIVIGRRGRTGLSELFLGSTSNYILHHASCSVLVIQH